MAERAFFCPLQIDKEKATPQKQQQQQQLYCAENDQLQQLHSSFYAIPNCSYSSLASSSTHAYPPHSSSSSHVYPSVRAAAACEAICCHHQTQDHHHGPNQQVHDHRHHHQHRHEYLHLIDEIRTCAKLKAEIVAHPLFENLLQAHVQCLSVGVSSNHLKALEAQLANRHSIIIKYIMLGKNMDDRQRACTLAGCKREIDAFMENYLQLLISWKKHLEEFVLPPTIKALSALCEIEQTFCDLTGLSSKEISSATGIREEWEDKCVELELDDGADYGIESHCDIDQSLLEHVRMELKNKLKESYKEHIIAMREEIIRKRQAGKLPGDITALKKWWNAHSRWPYPTDEEKKKLVQETGLEMRQVNNWFINHRKRNWIDRTSPANATASTAQDLSINCKKTPEDMSATTKCMFASRMAK